MPAVVGDDASPSLAGTAERPWMHGVVFRGTRENGIWIARTRQLSALPFALPRSPEVRCESFEALVRFGVGDAEGRVGTDRLPPGRFPDNGNGRGMHTITRATGSARICGLLQLDEGEGGADAWRFEVPWQSRFRELGTGSVAVEEL